MAIEAVSAALPALQSVGTGSVEGKLPLGDAVEAGGTFSDVMANALTQANASLQKASAAGEAFAAGRSDDIHGTMIALSEADISLRVVSTVRNKVIDAFYEMWRMNI